MALQHYLLLVDILKVQRKQHLLAEKAVEAVQAAPNYFFELLAKIKMFGNDIKGSGERITAKKYKDYTLEEDV